MKYRSQTLKPLYHLAFSFIIAIFTVVVLSMSPVKASGVISNLSVKDTTNAANWSIQSNLQVGNFTYGDRQPPTYTPGYTFTALPSVLLGADWIRTANSSKSYTGTPVTTFSISSGATVYIGLDDRDTKPTWLDATWTNAFPAGMSVIEAGGSGTTRPFSVYQKTFAAGTVSLGPLADTTQANFYTVAVIATSGGPTATNTPTTGPTITPTFVPTTATPTGSTTIYVSPSGSDSNPGTQSQPIKTIQHAQTLVRAVNANMSGDVTVFLNPGTYRMTQPLTLTASDSGTNGHNVIYKAIDATQTTLISGGVQVTGWTVSNASKNIWSAPAPSGLTNTRQLYIDGVRAQRAAGRLPVSLTKTSTGFTASSSTMASWRNPSDIDFVFTGGNSLWSEHSSGIGAWTEPRCPVGSISGTTITMAQPCWNNSTMRVCCFSGTTRTFNLVGGSSVGSSPEYVENAFELLDQPGEWYFDRSAHIIYYIPRSGENLASADVEAPMLETLVSGNGTTTAPVHNIEFSGLQFSYATWLRPSTGEGFSEIQANVTLTGTGAYATQALCSFVPNGTCPYGSWTKASANLSFSYDNNIQFLDDAFVHLGGAGLDLGNGSQSDTVQGSIFTDISANGVEIGDMNIVTPTSAQVTKNIKIIDNHLYDLPVEFHGGVAIFNGYSQNTTIQYNQIDHTAYSGISMGWGGWPDKVQKPAQPNPSQNNLVANNLIFDHMQLLADGSSIYTNGITGSSLSNGEHVTGNVIHDQIYGSGHGLYTDNGSSYITITSNVIFHTNFDNWGSRHTDYTNGGTNYDPLDIENNYWQQGDGDSSSKMVTEKGNQLINALNQAPASILSNAGLQPAYQNLLQKKFIGSTASEAPSRVAAFAGNGFAYVAWNPPIFEGSSAIQSYTVTSSHGNTQTISVSAYESAGYVKLTGLTNGTSYTFSVTATNGDGTSVASLLSGSVTPGTASVSVPTAPQGVSAHGGNGMASIHFTSPTSDGGSPIISYTVTASPGGKKLVITGRKVLELGTHTTFDVMDGLTSGTTYTLTITADNVAGHGASASVTVVP